MKNANNVWSTTERTYFYKAVIPTIIETPTPAAVNINKAEYFIDTDPGAGLGTNIPITSGLTITDVALPVPVSTLTEGLHQLLVRVRNASGVWSTTERTYFYKLAIPTITETPTPAAVNLNKAEYFIDTDPGIGLATNIPITPGLAVSDVVLQVPVTSLSEGLHQLLVRVRNASGVWSTTERTYFYKKTIPTITGTPTPAAVNITKAEYFIDTDPGVGAGTNITITPGTTITDLITPVSVSSLTEGTHKLYLRVRNANLVWSTTEVASFSVCNGNVPVAAAASAVTTSGFTANWATTTGALSYELDVSADNFVTFVSGYNAKVITAPTTSAAVTGLNPATTYKYRVRGYRTCASVSSSVITVGTPVATPSGQPTTMSFLAPGPTDINVSFTPAATLPSGYLVVRRAGAYSTFVPTNNTFYTKGQVVGDGVVAYVDAPPLLSDVGLTPNTNYYYSVYAYNQLNGFISYQTTAPLKGNTFTLAAEPAAQPTALQFTNVTSTSYRVSFSAATGNPTGYIVLRKAGSEPASVPVDGTAYTTTVGSDVIAYQGSALTFNETSLLDNTTYYYAIYAYNGSQTSLNYNTLNPLRGSQLTPLNPSATATNLQFSNITTSTITATYTAPVPAPAGYVVVRNQGSATSFVPQINTPYTVGSVTGGTIIYVGIGTTFTDAGLTPSTVYYYTVFSFNQNGTLISYQTVPPLQGSVSTFTAEPTAQATSLSFNSITATSMTLTFTPAVPAPGGYLVLRKTGSAPSFLPVDGNAYTSGNTPLSDGSVVVSSGASTSIPNTALLPGTTYYYQVFSFNGAGSATNYLTTGSNSGSTITVPDKPLASGATAVQQKQFTANWVASTGADSYRLDVSSDNFNTRIAGFDNLPVSGFFKEIIGLTPGTTYQYRVRAVNNSGTSANSDVITQITIPYVPKYKAATLDPLTGQTIFTANWNAAKGATDYFLDVSLANDFSSFVGDFQNKPLGNVATVQITGLTAGLPYYYRLRSKNAGGTSPDSTAVSQLMIPATPVGSAATGTTSTTFTATWQTATGATDYLLDVSIASDNFTPTLSAYTKRSSEGKLEWPVEDLAANTAYQYRVWAVNASGISPSSDPIAQLTASAIPIFKEASLVEQTTFKANWNAVTGATDYIIDVSATNDFATFVTGYPSNLTSNFTSKSIEGLSPGLAYYYRIRSKNAGGTSLYSATKSQLMKPATPIGQPAGGTTSTGFIAKWEVATGANEYRLDVSLESADFNPLLKSYTIAKTPLGDLATQQAVTELQANTAYKYRIRAVNASGESPNSSPISVLTSQVGSSGPISQTIPGLSSGGTVESYRMFSIPWELQNDNNNIESIFSSLGAQADDKWKLLRWNATGSSWDRYPKQISKVERGKSYWFNSMTQSSIVVTGTPHADNSFAMVLQPGWNQIGSPYDKNLSWTDVLAINSTVPNVSMVETNLYKFDPSPARYTTTDNLKAWSGNFVFNKGSQITLNIPSTTKVATGGRLSNSFESDISLNNWAVPFSLTVDGMEWSNSSIGMHPDAQPGIDSFDGMTVPRFAQYLELNSPHPEFFEPNFSSDIVPKTSSYNWHFVAETNLNGEYAVLSWNNQSLGSNEAKLILFDPVHGALINMKEVDQYQFKIAGSKHPLHFLYAKDAESLKPDITSLVQVYPNPVSTVVTFPFLTSSDDVVKLEIWDLTGKKIRTVIDREFPAGLQKVQWDVTDDQGTRVASGLYIYRFIGTGNVVQTGKLIIR